MLEVQIQKLKEFKMPGKNRGKMKLKNGGAAKKKRGTARGCGAATKGKGYNK
tara:strand:+ start:4460 stop:4615 length:156 start_codon:yes stop_codon:yes gene_type:complete